MIDFSGLSTWQIVLIALNAACVFLIVVPAAAWWGGEFRKWRNKDNGPTAEEIHAAMRSED